MVEKIKVGLLLFVLVIGFFLVAPPVMNFLAALFGEPETMVEYETAVQGRITGSEVNRLFHYYYLDGDTSQTYLFNGFSRPLTLAEQQLSLEKQNLLGVAHLLKPGDTVFKKANSTLLTVQRSDSTSRWFCSTPAEIEAAQKAAR